MLKKRVVLALIGVLLFACFAGNTLAEGIEGGARIVRVRAEYDGAWVNISEHQFKIFLPDGWQLIDNAEEAALMTAVDPASGNRMWIESMQGEGFTLDGVLEMFSAEEGIESVQKIYINEHPFVHYTSPESNVRGFITLTADSKHILIFKFSPADDEEFTRYAEMIMSTLSAYTTKAAKSKSKSKDSDEKKPVGIQTWAELLAAAKTGKTEILIGANLTRGNDEETAVFHSAVTIKSVDGYQYTLDGNGQQIIRIESGTDERLTDTSTISGLQFTNGQADQGGALFAEGDLVVEECAFYENSANNAGGAIYVTGDLELIDSVLAKNSAGDDENSGRGGGAFAGDSITISGHSSIYLNEAGYGGGVYAADDATVEDGSIAQNTASIDGGGVYAAEGYAYINGGTIAANVAGDEGGGVNAIGVTVNGGSIVANQAEYGGGIYSYNGDIVVNDGLIAGNRAEEGGGIFADNYGASTNVIVDGGQIAGNTATLGGAVYVEYGTVTDPDNCIIGDIHIETSP